MTLSVIAVFIILALRGDISPDNIMVQPDGKPVLLDLGAAKDLDIQGKDGSIQTTQMVAKQGFSPVEQYGRDGKIGSWTLENESIRDYFRAFGRSFGIS